MPDRALPQDQTPHIAPALTALVLGGALLAAFGSYARSLEGRSIAQLAASDDLVERTSELYLLKNQGVALQEAVFGAGTLLPFYGSSELNVHTPYERPFHPISLFHDYPTGFTVFPVGKAETTCLIILQKLAAVGPELQGKKVAISVTPSWFYDRLGPRADGYAGNFSALQAGELAFNARLSLELKREVARRMLQFPATLADQPLIRFALENLAEGSAPSLARYYASVPLGWLQNTVLRYQDHLEVVDFLRRQPGQSSSPEARNDRLDWAALESRAASLYRAHSDNNPFGVDNGKWDSGMRVAAREQKNTRTDEAFLRTLRRSQEWVDLELLLRECGELGARPMLLSMPIHGPWYDQCGITAEARRAYYEKLREVAARSEVPVLDFVDHDADRSFCHDYMGHLSPVGWLAYGRALDGFFHDAIPSPSALPARSIAPEGLAGAGVSSRATAASRPSYQGVHDPCTAEAIRGWVWDRSRPDEAIEVEILEGSKLLGRATANQLRGDLQRAGVGGGRHAFSFPVPSALKDGKTHSIAVKVAGAGFRLDHTPRPYPASSPTQDPGPPGPADRTGPPAPAKAQQRTEAKAKHE